MYSLFRALVACTALTAPLLASAGAVSGAGSSAAAPIYRSWAQAFTQATGHQVAYAPVGSSAGMRQITQGQVGFGATDVYPPEAELNRAGLIALPVAVTGISPVVNLPKIRSGQLRLTGEVLARIFLGQVRHWNAPEIAALNPDLPLPDLAIRLVVRADGSGTTYNFADYLAKVHPDWSRLRGVNTSLTWPADTVATKGSEGMARGVLAHTGAIGYVDHAYVGSFGLNPVQVQNADGQWVAPSLESFRAALTHSDWAQTGAFHSTLTQRPGFRSWPLTMGTFVMFPRVSAEPERTSAALRFVIWSFLHGDTLVQQNNFVRLPDRLQASAVRALSTVRDHQGRPLAIELLAGQADAVRPPQVQAP